MIFLSEPRGRFVEDIYIGKKLEPDTEIPYKAYIPAEYNGTQPAALLIGLDGLNILQVQVMDQLISEGTAPVCIMIGIGPGILRATNPEGADRGMRAEEYDQTGRGFPDFLIHEFIPWICAQEHLVLSPEADMHMIGGGSSGACFAWNAAWYRNDYFHRAFLSSPSFIAFRGGEELLVLARKSETRPIRAYVTVGSDEPNQYAGSSYCVGLSTESALKYAGYDFTFEYFEGGHHCCGIDDPKVHERVLRYLWKDWQIKPIRPIHFPDRISRMVDLESVWHEDAGPMPEKCQAKTDQGIYSFNLNTIILTTPEGNTQIVADDFEEITAVAISTDRWRLYIADKKRRFIFAMSICSDGSLKDKYILAPLHLAMDCRIIGAMDLCVDIQDRIYAATELGIQGIVSFGITDSIIPLPGDLPIDKIAFGGPSHDVLFAKSGNRIFKRKWKIRGHLENDVLTMPSTPGYND
jgi:Enterochelin esterase and related enzymes